MRRLCERSDAIHTGTLDGFALLHTSQLPAIPRKDDGAAGRLYESSCSLFALLKAAQLLPMTTHDLHFTTI
jgi:hypothetical protein